MGGPKNVIQRKAISSSLQSEEDRRRVKVSVPIVEGKCWRGDTGLCGAFEDLSGVYGGGRFYLMACPH